MTDSGLELGREAPRRRLARHLTDPLYRTSYLLILASAMTALLGFAFWVLAARSYPARVVGINSAAIAAMMVVSGLCQLGLPAVLIRYVPTAGERTGRLVIGSYAVTALLSLLAGAAAALTSRLWSPSLAFLGSSPAWIIGFALATTAWTVFTIQDGVLTGLRAAHWVPIENALFSIAKLALLLALTAVAPFTGMFLAWNIPAALAVLAVTAIIFGRLLPAAPARPRVSLDRRRLGRLAAGNYLAQLFAIALVFFMPLLVANLTDPATTAYFYAPWIIGTAILLIASNTTSSLTVEAALDEPQLAELARRTVAHTARLLVPAVAFVVIAAPLMLAAYGGAYARAGAPLLRLLALGALPNAVVALGLAVARVQQRGRALIAIQAAEAIPLLALSVALVPTVGIEGIGAAYLASQTAVALWLARTTLRPYLARGGRAPAT